MATTLTVKPSLTIKRRFNAPPEKVFAAWTDPHKVMRWMGPGEIKALHAESDLRTGGRYRWVMRAPNGEDHDVSGVYREIIPNEKLVFTWAWKSTPERESLVTLTFKRDGDGTSDGPLIRCRCRTAPTGSPRWAMNMSAGCSL